MRRNEPRLQIWKPLAAALLFTVTVAAGFSGCGRGSPEGTDTGAAGAASAAEQAPANAGRRLHPELPASGTRADRTDAGGRSYTAVLTARHAVTVQSRISGAIASIEVEEGDRVRAGEVLARLDDRSRRLQRDFASAEAMRTRALYERNRAAFSNEGPVRVVSALELEVSEAEYLKARADSALAELELSFSRITAPFDAVVVERRIEAGQWIAAQQELFTVADLSRLWAVFIVPEELVPEPGETEIAVSQPQPVPDRTQIQVPRRIRRQVPPTVVLKVAGGGEVFDVEGRLVRTSPVIDAASSGVKITVEIVSNASPGRRLKPGMTATLVLEAPGG